MYTRVVVVVVVVWAATTALTHSPSVSLFTANLPSRFWGHIKCFCRVGAPHTIVLQPARYPLIMASTVMIPYIRGLEDPLLFPPIPLITRDLDLCFPLLLLYSSTTSSHQHCLIPHLVLFWKGCEQGRKTFDM